MCVGASMNLELEAHADLPQNRAPRPEVWASYLQPWTTLLDSVIF